MIEKTRKKHGDASRFGRSPWKPGQSGNPAGRPKGSRNKLEGAFFDDVYAEWLEGGRDAVRIMRLEKPGDFVKVAASVLPQHHKVEHEWDNLTLEQIEQRIRDIDTAIATELGRAHGALPAQGPMEGGGAASGTKH